MRYGQIQVGDQFIDSECSIFRVVSVRPACAAGEVQIGIQGTWSPKCTPRYFSRPAALPVESCHEVLR